MANIKIAQLTNQTTIADTDIVLIETATSTNKMTIANLKSLLGIQDGGIEESGEGYIKYKNGTMMCFGRVRNDNGLTIQDGIFYKGDTVTIPYPQQFFGDPPSIDVTLERNDRIGLIRRQSTGITNFQIQGYVYGAAVGSGYAYYFNYVAIGKWK